MPLLTLRFIISIKSGQPMNHRKLIEEPDAFAGAVMPGRDLILKYNEIPVSIF